MMRILHVITALQTGGAEMMLLKLLSATRDRYSQAVISAKDEGAIGVRIKDLSVPLYALGLRPGVPDPLRLFTLRSMVRDFRPQAIQGWMYHGNLIAVLAGMSSRDRVPVLWNIRMSLDNFGSQSRMTKTMIQMGARFSWRPAQIIYNSEVSARQHEKHGYRAAKSVVIPNGFDCQMFRASLDFRDDVRAELGLKSDDFLVGLIARYHPMKDHAVFLRAAGLVARRYSNVYFLLAGSGVVPQEPHLVESIVQEQLQNRVFLLGERSDIPRLTAALDIACSSSWVEGFSNAIGEAMACGVPCVVTDVGDSAQIIGNTGLAVPPRDPSALADAISSLIESGVEHRRQLGMAARQRVEARFSLPAVARRYEDLYREVTSEKIASREFQSKLPPLA